MKWVMWVCLKMMDIIDIVPSCGKVDREHDDKTWDRGGTPFEDKFIFTSFNGKKPIYKSI